MSARHREAALIRHAMNDPREATKPARAGFMAKFEREVDPDETLSPTERAVRAKRLMKAHMSKLGRKSGQARRKAS